MRGVTPIKTYAMDFFEFQLTRLMRGVTRQNLKFSVITEISTHTPHARRDVEKNDDSETVYTISTHTPHARRDKRLTKKT